MMNNDHKYLQQAVELSRLCTPDSGSYCVGAVIVTASGAIFTGYTHQTTSSNHAEEEAILAAQKAGAELLGATIYSSIEPCSTRKSKPRSCSQLIIEAGMRKVVFALYEPDCFVRCEGAKILRENNIEVIVIDDFAQSVRDINGHLFR